MSGKLEPWKARTPKEGYCQLSVSLRGSPAFRALTKLQTDLYCLCSDWTYQAGMRATKYADPKKYPRDRWTEGGNIRGNDFYINLEKAAKCGLVNKTNKNTLYRAINALIAYGLIERVFSNKGRDMSVYRMSERWKDITDEETQQIKKKLKAING